MRGLLAAVIPLFLVMVCSTVQAQAPNSLTFQGRLTDEFGEPIDTVGVDMMFRFYKDTHLIWSETHSAVPVAGGVFNVELGTSISFDSVRFDQPIDLGVKIGDDAEMSPRTPLRAGAFARGMPHLYTFDTSIGGTFSPNVVAGAWNNVVGSSVSGGTIGGGGGSTSGGTNLLPNIVDADFGTIAGGGDNTVNAAASWSVIGGGELNTALTNHTTIGGGTGNEAAGINATIGGGYYNKASGIESTVPGGAYNRAEGSKSFAAGHRAYALHNGSFVWSHFGSDSQDSLETTGPNQFLIRAEGGVGIGTNSPRARLTVSGPDSRSHGPILHFLGESSDQVESGRIRFAEGIGTSNYRGAFIRYDGNGNKFHLGVHNASDSLVANDIDVITIRRDSSYVGIMTNNPHHFLEVGTNGSNGNKAYVTNGGTWTSTSSREVKEQFRFVDTSDILERVAALPILRWQYKMSDEGDHLGPMAEDFKSAFDLGDTDKAISMVDADGVALAAIQGLYELVKEQQREIERLRQYVYGGK